MQQINKDLLRQTAVGMRLIAQTTFYNTGNFPRLKSFVEQSYHPSLLEEQSVSARVAVLKAQYRISGRQKVFQVIAIDKHEAAVLMQQEKTDDLLVVLVSVEEDYPHRITRFEVKSQ
jgi:hypothetical protein